LLKKQIPIRAFSDWNEATPGFLEADLVAHCGTQTDGAFLNTLVLTDIASGWTEFLPLLQRSEANVIGGLTIAQELLPFLLQGLDADNGSEFINHKLLAFCEAQRITFTRSRAYHKNDQAHVEEKNGSICPSLGGL
jgi:IS30 family transposase